MGFFLRYQFWGAYIWRGSFSEFYGTKGISGSMRSPPGKKTLLIPLPINIEKK